LGFDFTWPWRASRALIAGQDPYSVIRPTGPFPFDGYFLYPLPAAIVTVPFAWMSAAGAAATFSGIGATLLTFGLSSGGLGRLPILLSPPFAITVMSGQWSAILMAAALIPELSWLSVCKPTVGGAAFAYRPNWCAVIGSTVLIGASFMLVPNWVGEWLNGVRNNPMHRYIAPVALIGGPFLLLSGLRWRTPEGRWLFVLALAPQVLTLYTALPPLLVARTRREALALSLSSTVAWVGWQWQQGMHPADWGAPIYAGYWLLMLVFVPALIVVLRRPNIGAAPIWVERLVSRAPTWIRGEPLTSAAQPVAIR
jgi:hypothetical protein